MITSGVVFTRVDGAIPKANWGSLWLIFGSSFKPKNVRFQFSWKAHGEVKCIHEFVARVTKVPSDVPNAQFAAKASDWNGQTFTLAKFKLLTPKKEDISAGRTGEPSLSANGAVVGSEDEVLLGDSHDSFLKEWFSSDASAEDDAPTTVATRSSMGKAYGTTVVSRPPMLEYPRFSSDAIQGTPTRSDSQEEKRGRDVETNLELAQAIDNSNESAIKKRKDLAIFLRFIGCMLSCGQPCFIVETPQGFLVAKSHLAPSEKVVAVTVRCHNRKGMHRPFAYLFPDGIGYNNRVMVVLLGIVEVDITFPGITREGNSLFFEGYFLGVVLGNQPSNLPEGVLLVEMHGLADAFCNHASLQRYLDFVNQDVSVACQLGWRSMALDRMDWVYTATSWLGCSATGTIQIPKPEFHQKLVVFISMIVIVFSLGELISAHRFKVNRPLVVYRRVRKE